MEMGEPMGQASTVNCTYDSFCDNESTKESRKQAKTRIMSVTVPGEDGARISRLAPHRKPIKMYFYDATTLVDAIERGCKMSGNGKCVGWRSSPSEYSWLLYSEFIEKAKQFGSGLLNTGADLGQHTYIGLYGKNSVEWMISLFGCLYYSSPIIPLYDTFGPDACPYMVNEGSIRYVVCGDETKVRNLLEKKPEMPSLNSIICIGELKDELKILGQEKGVVIHSFENILNMGKLKPFPIKRPRPDYVMEICYTSGTTGEPKGVLLTHENWVAAIGGVIMEMGPVGINKSEVVISYLPLAHVFEQTMELATFMVGGSVGYSSGDVSLLFDDMQALKPTFWPAVPRVLNKLYDALQSKLAKEENEDTKSVSKNKDAVHSLDPEFCKYFSKSLGGNIKKILSAAAPISEAVLQFYRQALECIVFEVYGQTETCGPCLLNIVTKNSYGHVGYPIPCNMVKLIDVPELGYFKKDGTGEMCVKGYNILQSYYKDAEKTKETIEENGWMHTGDIATWTPTGAIKIIDRIKHIFKLSQGEYIIPGKLENIYSASHYISQIFVYGDSLQSHLVAIVVADKNVVMPWCEKNLGIYSWEEACNDRTVKQVILEDMDRLGKAAGLMSYEHVKRIYLHPQLLSLQEEQLTPTLKIRRSVCAKYFAKEIEALYSENS